MRNVHLTVALAVVSLLVPFGTVSAAAVPLPSANLNATDNYVISVYEDLFDRPPDPTGRMTWTTALNSGTPRIAVANAITSSQEYRSGLITDAYAAYLGRGPDSAGLQFWLRNMGAGMTIEQLDSGFIASDEYWAAAGGTSADWVRALYADVLGREADASEVAFWVGRINGGATRVQVAMGFLLSTEYLSSVVADYYGRLLGRGPDPSGLASWVSAIQHGARDEQIVGGIVASEEYWTNESSRPYVGSISVSPTDVADVPLGTGWSFTVDAYQPNGVLIGDVTDESHITWDGQPCLMGFCQPTSVGTHRVAAEHRGLNSWATLTVVPVG